MPPLSLIFLMYQTLFAAKGIYSNWDRLRNITAGINYLQMVKKQVTKSLKSGYRGSTHTDVDTSTLVWRVANKAAELEIQHKVTCREGNSTAQPRVNILTTGFCKFQSSSLATFNKKLTDMRQGGISQPEVDDIAPCQVVEGADMDDMETGELSALHKDQGQVRLFGFYTVLLLLVLFLCLL
jgi:hypothetical protein